jgi:hypothetical protein
MAGSLDTAALVAATSIIGKGDKRTHKYDTSALQSHSLQVRVGRLADSCDLTGGNGASPYTQARCVCVVILLLCMLQERVEKLAGSCDLTGGNVQAHHTHKHDACVYVSFCS